MYGPLFVVPRFTKFWGPSCKIKKRHSTILPFFNVFPFRFVRIEFSRLQSFRSAPFSGVANFRDIAEPERARDRQVFSRRCWRWRGRHRRRRRCCRWRFCRLSPKCYDFADGFALAVFRHHLKLDDLKWDKNKKSKNRVLEYFYAFNASKTYLYIFCI